MQINGSSNDMNDVHPKKGLVADLVLVVRPPEQLSIITTKNLVISTGTIVRITKITMSNERGGSRPGPGGKGASSAQEGDLHATGIAVHHLLLFCTTAPHAAAVVAAHACT